MKDNPSLFDFTPSQGLSFKDEKRMKKMLKTKGENIEKLINSEFTLQMIAGIGTFSAKHYVANLATKIKLILLIWGVILLSLGCAQNKEVSVIAPDPVFEEMDGSLIYDYNPETRVGDKVYGTIVCDFENDNPGRNSHGGPVAMEYANGDLVMFHTNTSGHNEDGWSEYALSKDGGRTWSKNNKFKYSYNAYQNNQDRPAWVEQGLVTNMGTVVLFVTQIKTPGARTGSGIMRSFDHGTTWTEYQPIDRDFVGYPTSVAVNGDINYVLFDSNSGPHVLYVSTDDGQSWEKRSTLPLDNSKWYGAMCFMEDGRLLAGAYETYDERHFHYCISENQGKTWGEQKRAYVDKKIRDPELAYLDGRYYLHGRSGQSGKGAHRFVLYQSDDGENWGEGTIISSLAVGPDGYSDNCIINKYKKDVPNELMVGYSILYEPFEDWNTNEYVFFVKPLSKGVPLE